MVKKILVAILIVALAIGSTLIIVDARYSELDMGIAQTKQSRVHDDGK